MGNLKIVLPVNKNTRASKNKGKDQKNEKQESGQKKAKESAKINSIKCKTEKKNQREQKPLSKSKENPTKEPLNKIKNDQLIHEDYELQHDENGAPFREINGFIVRYEESDSDSSIDDTEFFRQIHARIRRENELKNKDIAK